MLNVFDIPKPQNGFVSVFPGFANANTQWVPWEKPAGITMVRLVCIGGGGGGGSGFPSATTNARGGGGGGGSSGISTVEIPAALLPDLLYVSAGIGGIGGASSTTVGTLGTDGIGSYVSIAQSTGAIYTVCFANPGRAGITAASATVVGTGGPAGAVATIAASLLSALGTSFFLAGQAGGAGGAVATGAGVGNITYPTTGLLLSGGAGGAGAGTGVAGSITAPASQSAVLNLFTTLTGVVAGATAGNGSPGVQRQTPLLSTGGSGGGANSGNALGGNGGNGGFGSGGGGGGAGGTTGGSGAGGNGGPGLVMIYSW